MRGFDSEGIDDCVTAGIVVLVTKVEVVVDEGGGVDDVLAERAVDVGDDVISVDVEEDGGRVVVPEVGGGNVVVTTWMAGVMSSTSTWPSMVGGSIDLRDGNCAVSAKGASLEAWKTGGGLNVTMGMASVLNTASQLAEITDLIPFPSVAVPTAAASTIVVSTAAVSTAAVSTPGFTPAVSATEVASAARPVTACSSAANKVPTVAVPTAAASTAVVSTAAAAVVSTIAVSTAADSTPGFTPAVFATEVASAAVLATEVASAAVPTTTLVSAAVPLFTTSSAFVPRISHAIVFTGCQNVTNKGLRAIAMKCTDLRRLSLKTMKNIDDGALQAIAAGCLNLERLELKDCKGITDVGIIAISKTCRGLWSLQELDMGHGAVDFFGGLVVGSSREGISNAIAFVGGMTNGECELGKEVEPSSLGWGDVFLGEDGRNDGVVSADGEVLSVEVRAADCEGVNQDEEFLLVGGVIHLRGKELLACEGDGVFVGWSLGDGSNGEAGGISGDIEMASGVGDLEDRGRGDDLLEEVKSVLAVIVPIEGLVLAFEFVERDREDLANVLKVGLKMRMSSRYTTTQTSRRSRKMWFMVDWNVAGALRKHPLCSWRYMRSSGVSFWRRRGGEEKGGWEATSLAFHPHKVGGLEVLKGELGGVERGSVEVVIGGGWGGVVGGDVMEKARAEGSGRGLVMGVESSIVVKHSREEVGKGHVGFVGEGGCKIFVAYSLDAGDERKVGNDDGGEVMAEGADVFDEAVRGTALAEVTKLFEVVIDGFLGAEGDSEKVGPLEEGVMRSSGGAAVADFGHALFGGIAKEVRGGNGKPMDKGHVVELERVMELGKEEENVLVGKAREGHDVGGWKGTGDFPFTRNDPGEGVEVEVIGGSVVAGVIELAVVVKEVVGGKLWHCRVSLGGDLGIGGTGGGDGGGRHDGLVLIAVISMLEDWAMSGEDGVDEVAEAKAAHEVEADAAAAATAARWRVDSLSSDQVTDASFISVAANCRKLEVLKVKVCKGLTNEGLSVVGSCCRRLRMLVLTCCDEISNVGIMAVGKGCPRLSVLVLVRLGGKIDDGLLAIGAGCPRLQVLDVSYCSISDVAIQQIVCGCLLLEAITLESCAGMSAFGLVAILRACRGLRQLRISPPENRKGLGPCIEGHRFVGYAALSWPSFVLHNPSMRDIADDCGLAERAWSGIFDLGGMTDWEKMGEREGMGEGGGEQDVGLEWMDLEEPSGALAVHQKATDRIPALAQDQADRAGHKNDPTLLAVSSRQPNAELPEAGVDATDSIVDTAGVDEMEQEEGLAVGRTLDENGDVPVQKEKGRLTVWTDDEREDNDRDRESAMRRSRAEIFSTEDTSRPHRGRLQENTQQ
ncbi:hypothetical protein CBR_g38523 [Chara braunii]|uniref:Uncharacterized protein n=1 Tax=Chara braunii TaxID=69332 RepID=A0A388JNV3_CHABU|nr:hypothetical protein CBR_g38523 [Chara braunii]|eukprot:GBG59499.1 hypothetical protein CBR_g38523 [Chara braunii]